MMKIHTDKRNMSDTEKQRSNLALKKMIVYLLYALNSIPFGVTQWNLRSFIHLSFTVVFDTAGFDVLVLPIYGIIIDKHLRQNLPKVFQLSMYTMTFFPLVNGVLFLYKSWMKEGTPMILNTLHEKCDSLHWSLKSKFWALIMNLLGLGGVAVVILGIIDNLQEDSINKISQQYPFAQSKNRITILVYVYVIYKLYLEVLWVLFTPFLTYIFIHLIILCESIQSSLKELVENETIYNHNGFERFIDKIKDVLNVVSFVDETYNINIGVYILMGMVRCVTDIYLYIMSF